MSIVAVFLTVAVDARYPVYRGSLGGGCRDAILTGGGAAQTLNLMYSISWTNPLRLDVSEVNGVTNSLEVVASHPVFSTSSGTKIVTLTRDTLWGDVLCLSDTGRIVAVKLNAADKTAAEVPIPVRLGTPGTCTHFAQGVVEGRSYLFACCNGELHLVGRDSQTSYVSYGIMTYSCKRVEVVANRLYILPTSDTGAPVYIFLTALRLAGKLLSITTLSKPTICGGLYTAQDMNQDSDGSIRMLMRCRDTAITTRYIVSYNPILGATMPVSVEAGANNWSPGAHKVGAVNFMMDPTDTNAAFLSTQLFQDRVGYYRVLSSIDVPRGRYVDQGSESIPGSGAITGLGIRGKYLVLCTITFREVYELVKAIPVRCDQFTCQGGFVDKPAKRTIYCGSSAAACTNVLCCNAKCPVHTCSAGFQDKASKATISCGALASQCSDATCCDAEVMCSSYTCRSGQRAKADSNTIKCLGMPPQCLESQCCDAVTFCNSHTCASNFLHIADASDKECNGMPPTCDLPTCCVPVVTCTGHTCMAGFMDKPDKATTVCGRTIVQCSDSLCCSASVYCKGYACGSGFQDKAGKDLLACGDMAADCSDAICCDAEKKCNTYTCHSGYQDKAAKDGLVCPGAPPECNDAKCCDKSVSCENFSCATGTLHKPDISTILCGGMPPTCDGATCCDSEVLCSTFKCPSGFLEKLDRAALLCPGMPPVCDAATCCVPEVKCDVYACVAATGFVDKMNKATITCGRAAANCTNALCCDVTCAEYACQQGYADKANKGTIVCLSDTCTVDRCCDTVYTPPPAVFIPSSAPTTSSPSTLTPTTAPAVPDTSEPTSVPTSIPTSVPTDVPTGVPVTGVPDTAVPSTPQPAVATADTPVPESGGSPPALPEVEQIATAGGIAAVGSALGGGGGAATRLVIASLGCHKEGEPPPSVPLALHPTQIQVMGSDSAGAVVGNTLIAVGFGCVCAVALLILQRFGRSMCPGLFTSLDTQGFLRLPSAPFFVFQLLYQGTTYGAMNLVLHPPSVGLCIAGFVSLLLCIVLPLLVFWTVTSNVPRSAQYMHDTRPLGAWMTILIGPGEWVSLHEDCHWVNRYATAVRMYRQELAWFSIIEFAGSFALSALSAVNATTLVSCGHVKISAALVFLIMLVVEARLWPHARMRDSAMDFVGLGLQMSAMVLMGAGYYSGARDASDSWTFATAGIVLVAAIAVVLLKLVLDATSELYIFCTNRRELLQEEAFRMFQEGRSLAAFGKTASMSSCRPTKESLHDLLFQPLECPGRVGPASYYAACADSQHATWHSGGASSSEGDQSGIADEGEVVLL